ncbi:MAG: EpsG family protein [Candidatus Doudnabacteria bacterium]|nr:EpsG family protein [Candidatus Doudnabacteria bacterium]
MKNPETKISTPPLAYLLFALVPLLIIRLVLLAKGPVGLFGYDYGFYLFAATHLNPLSASGWLVALWGGYSNPLFYAAKLFFIPPNILINEFYLFFSPLLALSFYWLFGNNKKSALFAVLLCAGSLIQTESYSMFLWKSWAAMPFLLLAIKFYQEKKWNGLIFSALAVALTHRTTLIVLLLSLAASYLTEQILDKKYRKITLPLAAGLALTLAVIFIPHLKSVVGELLQNKNDSVRTGLFLDGQNLFLLFWPYLLLALPGIYLSFKKRGSLTATVFSLVCLAWFLLKLPFYRRFLIYLDLSLIYYGAYFLGQIDYKHWGKKLGIALVLLFLFYLNFQFTAAKQPLISRAEIEEIKNFNQPGAFILATSADDAPWLLGFSNNARLGAPGLLEDPNSYEDWQNFWQGQNEIQFISHYPRPLFFYQRSYRLQSQFLQQCLIPVSENFFRYNYKCSD